MTKITHEQFIEYLETLRPYGLGDETFNVLFNASLHHQQTNNPVMQEGKEDWSDIIQRNKSKLDRPEFDAMVYGVPVDSTSPRSNPSQDLDTHSSNLL